MPRLHAERRRRAAVVTPSILQDRLHLVLPVGGGSKELPSDSKEALAAGDPSDSHEALDEKGNEALGSDSPLDDKVLDEKGKEALRSDSPLGNEATRSMLLMAIARPGDRPPGDSPRDEALKSVSPSSKERRSP